MADLTNAKIANTYKDLLQVNAETSNAGLDGTVRTIQDGGGTASPIAMSTAQLNVTGQFALAGTVLTATADQLNDLAVGKLDTLTAGDDTVKLTVAGVSVSTATVSATVVVNPVLSLTEVDAATGSFNTQVSATNFIAGTGSFTTKVSGVAAEFSGNVSAANVYASTNIFVAGESIPSAITSVNAVIAAVSALTSVNKAAITSINSGTFNSLDVETSVQIGDFINLDGKIITITGDTDDTFKITAGANGATTLETVDTAGAAADLTLDVDGKIILDSGDPSGTIEFDNRGTLYGDVLQTAGRFYVRSRVSDQDIAFQGLDGGSGVNALIIDMSEAGKAIFNAGATFADAVTVEDISLDGKVLTITGDTGDTFTITSGANGATTLATVDTAGNAANFFIDADGYIRLDSGGGYGVIQFAHDGTIYGDFHKSGDNIKIRSGISNGNIILSGYDDGVGINALSLDMSEAGLATFNAGATFNGDVTLTGDANNVVWDKSDNSLEFADDAKAVFGTGGDLQIFHNGSNSFISHGGTGDLLIRADRLQVLNAAANETMINAVANGAVTLYYDNSAKLATTATGATITGGLTADSATVDDISLDGKVLTITGDTDDTFKITTGANGYTTLATVDTAAANGHLVLDVDGQINLDAGDASGATLFKSSGTHYGTLYNSGSNLYLRSEVSDGNIIFKGNDGGVSVTPLLLDMSDAGKAYFYAGAIIDGDVTLTGAANNVVWDKSDNSLEFSDNAKAVFGAGGDLEIYHTGTDNYIQTNGTGPLRLRDSTAGDMIHAESTAVRLYHAGATKLTTTATGATVTGGIVADSATVDDINLDGKVLTITGDTDDTFTITTGAAGATTLATTDAAGTAGNLTLDADGSILLNTANSGLLYLQDSGSNYGALFEYADDMIVSSIRSDADMLFQGNDGGSTITALTLDMSAAGAATFNNDVNTSWGGSSDRYVRMYYSESYHMGMRMEGDGPARDLVLYTKSADSSGDIRFETGSTLTEKMTILSGGNVGIGTAAPSDNLHIASTGSAGIFIQADTDNADETHVPTLSMASDGGGAGQFILGIEGNAGTAFTGSLANANYIHAKNSTSQPLQFANASQVIMTLTDGKAGIGTSAPTSTLHVTGDATVDDINLNGKVLTITGDTDDTFKITSGANGATTIATVDTAGGSAHLTVDTDGLIILDSGGSEGITRFQNNGTLYGEVLNSGDNFYVRAQRPDGDLILQGETGGSFINALRLDISAAGKAIFNAGATFADDVTVEDINLSGKVLTITGDTSDTFTITTGAAGATTLATTDAAGADGRLIFSADGMIDYVAGDLYNQHRFFGGSMSMTIMPGAGNSGTDARFRNNTADADLLFLGNDGGAFITALKLDMSEAGWATFNTGATFGGTTYGTATVLTGAMTAASATVDDIVLDGKVITITGDTGDTFTITAGAAGATTLATTDAAGTEGTLKLDADGGIHLDAGSAGGPTILMASGTRYGTFVNGGNNFYLRSDISDGDLILQGYDGGSTVNALTLDMSDAGKAIFNAGARFNNDVTLTTGKVGIELTNSAAPIASLNIANDSADGTVDYSQGIVFSDSTTGGTPWTHAAIVATGSTGYNGNLIFATDGDDGLDTDLSGLSERMRIDEDGNVGIATTTPLKKLHVDGPALSTVKTLTDASTVTSDFDTGQNFTLTLAGNRTLGAPSNVDAGQVGSIFIIQDGTGSRTLAYNSIWKFAGGTAPTLSTAAGAIDRLDYIVQSGTAIQAVLTEAYA